MAQANIEPLWKDFENGLRDYISKNAAKISFTSPLYVIDKKAENHYDVTVTITDLGTQRFEIKLAENEFLIRAKMIDTPAAFPHHLLEKLLIDMTRAYTSRSIAASIPIDKQPVKA